MLKAIGKGVDDRDIVGGDAGVKISDLQSADIEQYVVRLATNFTARRNYLPDHTRGRKPTYGAIVRPLARQHKGKTKPATAADEVATWQLNGRPIRVEIWRHLVLPKTIPNNDNLTFDVYAFHDPAFKHPWLLATPVLLRFESVHAIYTDRWPVEQIPLSAKQMLGTHRQFVHPPKVFNASLNWRSWPVLLSVSSPPPSRRCLPVFGIATLNARPVASAVLCSVNLF